MNSAGEKGAARPKPDDEIEEAGSVLEPSAGRPTSAHGSHRRARFTHGVIIPSSRRAIPRRRRPVARSHPRLGRNEALPHSAACLT